MTREVVVVVPDAIQRGLIVAQLQEETGWTIDGAATIADALALDLSRAALVILDWLNLDVSDEQWAKLRSAARGVPILVLASRADRERIARFGVDAVAVMYRPFTIGDVVSRARTLLKGKVENG